MTKKAANIQKTLQEHQEQLDQTVAQIRQLDQQRQGLIQLALRLDGQVALLKSMMDGHKPTKEADSA